MHSGFFDISYSANNSDSIDGQVFPDSSERLLTATEVRALDDEELRLAINEIYARHGYIFKDGELLSYYKLFDWYEPTVSAQSFSIGVFILARIKIWKMQPLSARYMQSD